MRRLIPLTAGPIAMLAFAAGPDGMPTSAPTAEAANCSYADSRARGPLSRARADRALAAWSATSATSAACPA